MAGGTITTGIEDAARRKGLVTRVLTRLLSTRARRLVEYRVSGVLTGSNMVINMNNIKLFWCLYIYFFMLMSVFMFVIGGS